VHWLTNSIGGTERSDGCESHPFPLGRHGALGVSPFGNSLNFYEKSDPGRGLNTLEMFLSALFQEFYTYEAGCGHYSRLVTGDNSSSSRAGPMLEALPNKIIGGTCPRASPHSLHV